METTIDKNREFEQVALVWRAELLDQATVYLRNREEAADLVQETFLKAYAAWESFEQGTSCRRWLHRILRNAFLSRCRRWSREVKWLSDRRHVVESLHISGRRRSRSTPERRAAERFLQAAVAEAMDELPEEFRQVLEMHCIEGKRYREIAEALGCPVGTVMSRVHRARKHLRETLSQRASGRGTTSEGSTPGERRCADENVSAATTSTTPLQAHLVAA